MKRQKKKIEVVKMVGDTPTSWEHRRMVLPKAWWEWTVPEDNEKTWDDPVWGDRAITAVYVGETSRRVVLELSADQEGGSLYTEVPERKLGILSDMFPKLCKILPCLQPEVL